MDAPQELSRYSKCLVQFANGSKKANLEIEIAIDMPSLVGAYDITVLLSSNGDFICAVCALIY